MASKELLPGGVEVWRSRGCEVRQWSPAPGIVVNRYVGEMSEDLAAPVIAFVERAVEEAPRVTTFSDAELVTGYDVVFRVRMVLGLQRLRGRIDKLHVYSRSMAALTGMRAANLVLGNIVAHSSRQSLEADLARGIAERTGGPRPGP